MGVCFCATQSAAQQLIAIRQLVDLSISRLAAFRGKPLLTVQLLFWNFREAEPREEIMKGRAGEASLTARKAGKAASSFLNASHLLALRLPSSLFADSFFLFPKLWSEFIAEVIHFKHLAKLNHFAIFERSALEPFNGFFL